MSPNPAVALLLAAALAGCASPPPPEPSTGAAAYALEPDAGAEPFAGKAWAEPGAGEWAVAAVGTPFFLAFKTVACVGSVAIAAPTSALIALGGHQARQEGLDVLGSGVAQNCGPPYVLSP